MIQVLVLLLAIATGLGFFIIDQPYIVLGGLLLLTLALRFRGNFRDLGKLVEILLVFYFIWYAIESLQVTYPGSLIIILTFMVILIFFEGPEWGRLYFGAGRTGKHSRHALLLAIVAVLIYGAAIYMNSTTLENPVPIQAPIDTLIVMGIGFAFYLSIMEQIIFRSFIYQRFEAVAGSHIGVIAQGLLYGAMLYRVGVPNELPGACIGAALGIALGYLVQKSASIYPAMLAHFVVTLGVFFELAIVGRL